jgi:NAD(P)-dependent dehydrogenase (short-subunit alcohol dehydrogenase family)
MARYDFNGKVAVVTGGGSGIGAACAKTLAAGGAKVVVADYAVEHGQSVAAEIKEAGGEAMFVPVDVSKPDAVERMVARTVEAYERLDLAVNNAGVAGEPSPTGAYTVEGWRRVIGVNLDGVFYCMRYEIPRMLEGGGGAIVNMASILGSVGFRTAPAYVAAKHGVVGLTKAAALEYADRRIRINSVGPAFINTPLLSALDEAMMNQIRSLHPIGRLGEPQEVANLVAFLCSDDASYMTGGYYLVDGAYTAP